MQLHGIHHLTAITANARGNYNFYTDLLGMRLVKKTVNQDDVAAYHLFYADGKGTPGTDLTFFVWPATPEQRGTHSIVRTGLRISGESAFKWWRSRFRSHNVRHARVAERDGRLTLDFEDPEGQRFSLIDDGGAGSAHPWERSSVPPEHQIRGLGPITISIPRLDRTERILIDVLGMRAVRQYGLRIDGSRLAMGPGGVAELHVAVERLAIRRARRRRRSPCCLRTSNEEHDVTERPAKARIAPDGPKIGFT
jgi:glyoxalase family protein